MSACIHFTFFYFFLIHWLRDPIDDNSNYCIWKVYKQACTVSWQMLYVALKSWLRDDNMQIREIRILEIYFVLLNTERTKICGWLIIGGNAFVLPVSGLEPPLLLSPQDLPLIFNFAHCIISATDWMFKLQRRAATVTYVTQKRNISSYDARSKARLCVWVSWCRSAADLMVWSGNGRCLLHNWGVGCAYQPPAMWREFTCMEMLGKESTNVALA